MVNPYHNLYKPTAVFSREEICDISWRNQPLQIQNSLKRKPKMWKSLKSLGPGEMNGNRRRTGLPVTIMRFCSERKSVIELLAFPNGVMIEEKKKKWFFVPVAKFRDRVTISKHIFPKHYSYFRSNSLSWTCCLLTVHRIQVCGYSMPSFGLVLSVFSFHVEISL